MRASPNIFCEKKTCIGTFTWFLLLPVSIRCSYNRHHVTCAWLFTLTDSFWCLPAGPCGMCSSSPLARRTYRQIFSPHPMAMYSMLNCKVGAEIVRRNDNNVTAHTSLSLQIGLMSVTVFPVRLLLVSFFMLLAWPFAFTASLGRSEFVVEPQCWWRRCVCVLRC